MTRTMHLALIAGAVVVAPLTTLRVSAQEPTVAQKVAAIKAGVAANQAAIRKYTWLQTTTVAFKGEVKSTKVSQCSYQGTAPKPVCTQISEESALPPKGGPLIKHEAEKKGAEMKAYMDSVGVLMTQYIPPDGALMDKAANSGNVSVAKNPSAGTTKVVISNYVEKGDAMTLIVDPAGKLGSAAINTWLNDPSHAVTLQVTFAVLPDGTSYASPRVLNATDKQIVVTTTLSQFGMAPGA
jgi:hypothetical protein